MNQDDWLRKRLRQRKRPGCAGEVGALVVGACLLGGALLAWLSA